MVYHSRATSADKRKTTPASNDISQLTSPSPSPSAAGCSSELAGPRHH